MKRFIESLLDGELALLIGNLPLLQRFFPNRGWYRRMYYPFSQQPRGPYPTRKAALVGGDPLPPQEIDYCLTMPDGCHDIRKQGDSPF